MRTRLLAGAGCFAIATSGLSATNAQAQNADTLGDPNSQNSNTIIVTAERREANLQDVPVAVQVISNEELERAGVSQLTDLEQVSSSLIVNNVTSNVNAYIRGVGSTVQGSGFSPSVAIYVDGIYVSRLTSGSFDLDNIESLQVLRGPQGALYGRSATGGAIVITTNTADPGDPISGRVSATYGNYDTLEFSGRVSGGLGDNAAFSLTATKRDRDGFINNLTPAGFGLNTEDLDDRDSFYIGGSLVIEPTPDLNITLRGSYFDATDRNGMAYQPVGLDLATPPFGLDGTSTVLAGTLIQFGLPIPNALAAAAGFQYSGQFGETFDVERNGYTNGVLEGNSLDGQFNHLSLLTLSAALNWDLGDVTLTSISSYTDSESDASVAVIGVDPRTLPAGFNGGSIGFSGDLPSEAFTQEIQIASDRGAVEWVAGIYYLKEDGSTDLTGDLFGLSLFSARNDWEVESISAFAQVTIPFTDRFSGTIGGRYTDETFTLADRYDPTDPRSISPLLPNFGTRQQDSSQFTYTARLNYDTGPLLVYGGISTGFKAGTLSAINPSSPGVEPEEITSFEVGLKSEPASGVRLNFSAFYYDYNNIHIAFTDSTSGASLLVNGTGGEVMGAEVEFFARPSNWLTLRGGATILDTEYDQDVVALGNTVALGGQRLVGAPEFSFALGADFRAPWIEAGDLVLATSLNYNSGYFFDGENKVGTGGVDASGYATVNLNLSYAPNSENWSVALWANNIFDEEYFQAGITQGFINRQAIPSNPAQYGITIGFGF